MAAKSLLAWRAALIECIFNFSRPVASARRQCSGTKAFEGVAAPRVEAACSIGFVERPMISTAFFSKRGSSDGDFFGRSYCAS